MSLRKYIHVDSTTTSGEPRVQILRVSDVGRRTKLASEALEYIKDVSPEPGKTFILVLAMTAGEYYGDNRNGDAFAETPIPGVTEQGETLLDWYKTFEDAGIYAHHVNKDKSQSMGEVVKAFYNKKMHRVELLLKLDNSKAAKYIAKIEAGEFPAVSMGTKIPYDVCSIRGCHNKAKTTADYCIHARNMGDIHPKTGEKNFVWNPSPNFFDISFVFKPADRVAFMMKKVAHTDIMPSAYAGDVLSDLISKTSTAKKLSEMSKRLTGEVAAAKMEDGSFISHVLPKSTEKKEPFPSSLLDDMASVPLPVSMSTCHGMGITPTVVEITRICLKKVKAPSISLPTCQRIAGLQTGLLTLLGEIPEIISSLEDRGVLGISGDLFSPKLAEALKELQEKRADTGNYIYRRTVGDPDPTKGKWDPVILQGSDGSVYQSTLGAVEEAQDKAVERKAVAAVGTGALAGTAYKILSGGRIGRFFAPLFAGGTMLGGKAVYDSTSPATFPGTDIPLHVEAKKVGSVTDANVYDSLAQEYLYGTGPDLRAKTAYCKTVAFSKIGAHPAITMLLTINDDRDYAMSKIAKFIQEPAHPSEPRTVDIDGLACWLGEGLLS